MCIAFEPSLVSASDAHWSMLFAAGEPGTASTTRYLSFDDVSAGNANRADVKHPSAGQLSRLQVEYGAGGALLAGSLEVVVQKNGVDSALACTLSAASGESGCSNPLMVMPYGVTDTLRVRITSSGLSPSNEVVRVTALVDEGAAGTLVRVGAANPAAAPNGSFCGPSDTAAHSCNESSAVRASWTMPGAASVVAIAQHQSAAVGNGQTELYTLHNLTRGADVVSCSVAAGAHSCQPTSCTHDCAVATGDRLVWRFNVAGANPAVSAVRHPVVEFAGVGTLFGARSVYGNGTRYIGPRGQGWQGDAPAKRAHRMAGPTRVQALTVEAEAVLTSPMAFSLCHWPYGGVLNCATGMQCAIAAGATACSVPAQTSYDVAEGDQIVLRGQGAAAGVSIGAWVILGPQGPPPPTPTHTATFTATVTRSATASVTRSATHTRSPTASHTATVDPSLATATPSSTPLPSATPSAVATNTATRTPTGAPPTSAPGCAPQVTFDHAGVPINTWTRVLTTPCTRFFGVNHIDCNEQKVLSHPVGRSFSGVTLGHDCGEGTPCLFFFGGTHGSHPGNDVELYDVARNTWVQQYQPECLPECCVSRCSHDPGTKCKGSCSITTDRQCDEDLDCFPGLGCPDCVGGETCVPDHAACAAGGGTCLLATCQQTAQPCIAVGGAAPKELTPSGLNYVQHAFQRVTWNPTRKHFIGGFRAGAFTYDPAIGGMNGWTHLTLVQDDGSSPPFLSWRSGIHQKLMIYDPELDAVLWLDHDGRVVQRLNYDSGAWEPWGTSPNDRVCLGGPDDGASCVNALGCSSGSCLRPGGDITAGYSPDLRLHLIAFRNGTFYLYDAVTRQWSVVPGVPDTLRHQSGLLLLSVTYDPVLQQFVILNRPDLDANETQLEVWTFDGIATWQQRTIAGAPPIVGSTTGRWGVLWYDEQNQLFWLVGVYRTGGGGQGGIKEGDMQLWALRLGPP